MTGSSPNRTIEVKNFMLWVGSLTGGFGNVIAILRSRSAGKKKCWEVEMLGSRNAGK
jgi:hypothetical protein